MKNVILIFSLMFLAVAPFEPSKVKAAISADSIGINVYNGTTDNAGLYMYGPTNLSQIVPPGSASYGPLETGNYTINVYANTPGTHTFTLNGQSITTSTGSATFSNVNIIGTPYLSIN